MESQPAVLVETARGRFFLITRRQFQISNFAVGLFLKLGLNQTHAPAAGDGEVAPEDARPLGLPPGTRQRYSKDGRGDSTACRAPLGHHQFEPFFVESALSTCGEANERGERRTSPVYIRARRLQ